MPSVSGSTQHIECPSEEPAQIASTDRRDLREARARDGSVLGGADLRSRIAVQTFKLLMLEARHDPALAQTRELLDMLATSLPSASSAVSDKTWEAWFAGRRGNKATTIKALDAAAQAVLKERSAADRPPFPTDYFATLVRGGLLERMTHKMEVQPTPQLLWQRACAYRPRSPLHLHLDAIEAAGLVTGVKGLEWRVVKAIAGSRILAVLHSRWALRGGAIYAGLDSSLKLALDGLSEAGRGELRARYSEAKPDQFERAIREGARPDWRRCGIEPDCAPQHVYKTLFRLAADETFLRGNRLEAWALDIATSALALFAVAWSDRRATFGMEVSDEPIFWAAFDQLLFEPDPDRRDATEENLTPEAENCLSTAATVCDLELTPAMLNCFAQARQTFRAQWRSVGGRGSDALMAIDRCMAAHPLRTIG